MLGFNWECALLALQASCWACAGASRLTSMGNLKRRAQIDPDPISISPSQNWDGPDGPWSSFTLRIGTPAQDLRVFISTASQSTWVINSEGCPPNDDQCPNNRGNLFIANQSSTWSQKGYYNLGNEENLNMTTGGTWGNETVGLGVQGSGGPTLENQIIAEINSLDFFLGMFGVNPKPTNYTGLSGDSQDSYMTTLKKQNLIPSVTFGYSAGAKYRLKQVLGTLTLGGYDENRFTPNPLSFDFAPDNDRDLVVGIQAIKSTAQSGTTTNLLPGGGINSYIDSTIPYIYLPTDSCKAFEDAFGLEWNADRNLYPITNDQHEKLISLNASITFTLGNSAQGGQTVDITLPYKSFDLQLQWPIVTNTTRYFPLKRATNDTQYTLGRTFLQEAYLIVDYERSNFSVSQARFEDGLDQKLTAIKAVNATLTKSTSDSSGTSKGTIAGIAIGVILFILICGSAVAAFFLIKRSRNRKRKEAEERDGKAASSSSDEDDPAEKVRQGFAKAELATGSDNVRHEFPGDESFQKRAEIDTPPTHAGWVDDKARNPGVKSDVAEMNGGDVSRLELAGSGEAPTHEMYDPSTPAVELPAEMPRELHGSSVPPSRSTSRSPVSADQNAAAGWPLLPRTSSRGQHSNGEPSPLRSETSQQKGQLAPSDSQARRAVPRSQYSAVHTGEVHPPSLPSAPTPSTPAFTRSTLTRSDTGILSPVSPMGDTDDDGIDVGAGRRSPQESDGLFSRLRGLAQHSWSGSSSNNSGGGKRTSGGGRWSRGT